MGEYLKAQMKPATSLVVLTVCLCFGLGLANRSEDNWEDDWHRDSQQTGDKLAATTSKPTPDAVAQKPVAEAVQVRAQCHSTCAKSSKNWFSKCSTARCSGCAACSRSVTELIQAQDGHVSVGNMDVHVSPK